jgi:hypothetical protein
MLIAPEEGFPWNKVNAAKRYLTTIKPWWGRFLDEFVIVPVEVMPDFDGVLPYGSTTATDRDFRIYIDRLFALSVPLHYLAGAIEHELQRHTRDSWQRFKFLKDEAWREEAVPALDLEINSTIDREQKNLSMGMVWGICNDSALFTARDLEYWNVTAPPGFDDDGWIPRVLGMEDGLSAEQYHQVIKKLMEEPPPPEEDEGDTSDSDDEEAEDDAEGDEDSQDEAQSDNGQSEESEESEDAERDENGEESEDEDSESSDSNEEDDGDDQEGEGEGDQESDDEQEGDGSSEDGDAKGSSEGLDNEGGSGDGDSEEGDESSSESESSESNNDSQESQDGEPSDSESSSESSGNGPKSNGQGGEGSGNSSQSNNSEPKDPSEMSDWDKAEAVRELQNSELGQMWQNSIENPTDPIDHPAWKPSDNLPEYELPDKPSQGEMSAAFEKLSEDIGEFSEEMGDLYPEGMNVGDEAGNALMAWRENYRKARGLNWDRHFMKLANAMLSSTQIKGQSDLSYSVRNPNQSAIGPILQGLLSYSPTIYVLQDVSGSMHAGKMARSMSVFTDLCKKVLANYGDKVTWFSADTALRDVGTTSRWNEDVRQAWSYGFGGTQGFGEIIDVMMRGKLVYKGKKYKKPDLVITSTDCCFPWVEERPRSAAKLLIVNVGTEQDAEMWVPEWVNRRKEFVQVD